MKDFFKNWIERAAELFVIILAIIFIMFCLQGCGTLSRMEKDETGKYVEVPIMTCRTLARDLTYSKTKTTTLTNGTVIVESETYTTKGTTAGVIGAGAQLLGAASNLSPF